MTTSADLQDRIDRYLSDLMTESELDAFEEELLTSLPLQNAVRTSREIRLAMSEAGPELMASSPVLARGRRAGRATWAIAASVVAVSLGMLILTETIHSDDPVLVGEIVMLERARSGDPEAMTITGDRATVISVDALRHSGSVELSVRREGDELFKLHAVPGPQSLVSFLVPELGPGRYDVTVSSPGTVDRYTFEVPAAGS